MTDRNSVAKSLRGRFSGSTEERLGRALSELLENPLVTGAVGRAFDAREKASQAQEVAMGALNIPSSADIERLTRRLRSVSQRLEGIEDGIQRLDRALSHGGLESRLAAIEQQLENLAAKLDASASVAEAAAAQAAPPRGLHAAAPPPGAPAGAAREASGARPARPARRARAAAKASPRARAAAKSVRGPSLQESGAGA